jgi:hypothetical protein
MTRMRRTRLLLAAVGLAAVAGSVVPAVAAPSDPVPAGSASSCVANPPVWISGGYIYVQVGCKAPIAIPIPITGPPPGA